MASRGPFSPLLAPGLAAVFFRNLRDRPTEYTRWLPEKKSRRAYEEEYKIAGLGQFVYKAEGSVYTFDEPIPGATIRFIHQTFGLGFRVTEEMIEDDLYGVMSRMSKELSRSATLNREVQGFSPLNNAFNALFTGYDGVSLVHAAHPLLGGGTLSNLVTGDFSQDALQSAIELFENFTDDRGYRVMVTPKFLMHAPPNIWEVGKVLESELEANTADNNANIIRTRYGIQPDLYHYFTDTDAWFLRATKSDIDDDNGARMYNRVSDQFRSDDDPLNGDALFTGRHRISTGFGDFRWVVGSAGA